MAKGNRVGPHFLRRVRLVGKNPMKSVMTRFALMVVLLSGIHGTAWGVCQLKSVSPVTVSSYEGIAGNTSTVQSFQLQIENTTGVACDYLITTSNGNNMQNGSRAMSLPSGATGSSGSSSPTGTSSTGNLPYDILSGSNKVIGDATTAGLSDNDVLEGTVSANDTKTVTLQMSIPAGQLLPASETAYADTVTVNLYNVANVAALNGAVVSTTQSLNINTYVKPQLLVALCDKGTDVGRVDQLSYTVNLGDNLLLASEKAMDVVINGNDGYVLSFQSNNQGKLVQQKAQGPFYNDEECIRYTMTYAIPGGGDTLYTLSGPAVNLNDPSNPRVSAGTVINGQNNGRITLRFNVNQDDIKNALAGTYRDNIIVTVQNPS